MKQSRALRVYGSLWFAVGAMLLTKGVRFLSEGPKITAVFLAIAALVIGLFKARFVLAKAASKMIARLDSFSDTIPLKQLFTVRYCLILGLMAALGITLRILHLRPTIHGFIDLAIGSALLSSSFIYFKRSFVIKRTVSDCKSSIDLLQKDKSSDLVSESKGGKTD
jgi:uncharacterized protein YacL